ncbi:hypothetical protein BCR34DRAFT_676498 [Clohesyomyces aquaticus]|uniref:Uncharacterized protein n=1 Tax=Clohesyomyces aquaticus TaxID=1231657 RepID=A0A1Y1YT85_9PLEO|nr:hypothetical protein BCR34DRAFT_676498 [Clohesyomyces aquaticus]
MPAASVASAPVHRTSTKTPASRTAKKPAAARKPATNGAVKPATNGATNGALPSPYGIMASRIANRVAEMAENITFVERERPQQNPTPQPAQKPIKKAPRKLDIRMPNNGASPTNITFSAPFLDNTLSKLLSLQNRMLSVSNDIAASEDVDDKVKHEQFNQSAELSRIIALICAEKARQGA